MKRITLIEEQAKQIYQDYLQGLSLDKLGEKYQISRHIYTKYMMTQQYIWIENIKKFQKFTVVLRSNSQNYKRDNCWETLRASITIV